MKTFAYIIFTFCYLSIQCSFSIVCLIDYAKKFIVEHQYNNHLKKLPARFNLLAELNKYKEHKKQSQKKNHPDFNHQLAFSAHHRAEDLALPDRFSKPLIFNERENLKSLLVFNQGATPPPRFFD